MFPDLNFGLQNREHFYYNECFKYVDCRNSSIILRKMVLRIKIEITTAVSPQ